MMTDRCPLRRAVYCCLAAISAAMLAACAVGPDFRQPEAPQVDRYTSPAMMLETHGNLQDQKLLAGSKIPADWWKLFGSTALDRLIEQGLANSPTVAAFQARLREAQANMKAQVGSVLYPSIDGRALASRQKISGAAFGGAARIYNVYNASLGVSYGLDLFGGSRRYLESLRAQIDHEQYQLQAARITLAANIVTAAVQEASLRRQIAATQEIIAANEAQLGMVEQQYEHGAVAQLAVLGQRSELARTRTALPALQKQLEQNRNLLKTFIGELPASVDLPEFTLESLHLPDSLPLSLPSDLVRQRPDILAAEAMLHVASANVGVATANMYPRITLTGGYGSEARTAADLFGAGTSVWSAGAGLVQPLFHGGELRAKKQAAVAAYEEAEANYRDTVLQAFREVGDSLLALEMDSRSYQLQREAETASGETLALVRRQYDAGAASYLELLDASRRYQQAAIDLAQAEAARIADSAVLIHVLGGGWWNEQDGGEGIVGADSASAAPQSSEQGNGKP